MDVLGEVLDSRDAYHRGVPQVRQRGESADRIVVLLVDRSHQNRDPGANIFCHFEFETKFVVTFLFVPSRHLLFISELVSQSHDSNNRFSISYIPCRLGITIQVSELVNSLVSSADGLVIPQLS